MDTATIISILSLIVALLALPTSYWIAVRQVKLGLVENERRIKQRARINVADRLNEFFNVFYAAARQIAHIEPGHIRSRPEVLDPHMDKIDTFVEKTLILRRLAVAIDELLKTYSLFESKEAPEVITRLQSIRNQIELGSDATRYATLGIISAWGGLDIQSTLINNVSNWDGKS